MAASRSNLRRIIVNTTAAPAAIGPYNQVSSLSYKNKTENVHFGSVNPKYFIA